ncbi:MAG: transglycosylase domain-containing protein [Pseudomonadota bacterium]
MDDPMTREAQAKDARKASAGEATARPNKTGRRRAERKKKTVSPIRRFIGQSVRILAFCIGILIAIPLVLVPLYSVVPAISTLMLYDLATFKGYKRTWVSLDDIAPVGVNSVMVSEDARHCEHNGVDWAVFYRVVEDYLDGGRARGASTITMQTVKNLFLTNHRSVVRKAVEIPIALYADLVWSKRRTMEIYLNIAEWDNQVYGIGAASEHYFGRPASKLNRRQAALLAVSLPNPKQRNPAKPSRTLNRLANTIVERARAANSYNQCVFPKKDAKSGG